VGQPKDAERVSVVEHVTERIAFGIASGIYPPGTTLPSVRKLAVEYGINPSTIQVVLGRLQATGFVDPHQRLGIVVRDVQLMGGIETWRYLFRFSQQLPDLAASMLEDILATRAILVASAARAIAKDPTRFDTSGVRRAVDQLELLVAADRKNIPHIARAELHVVRMVIATARQGLALPVFNSVGEMLIEVPEVVRTMYADAQLHAVFWKAFLATWESGKISERGISTVEKAIRERDVDTVKRFRSLLIRSRRQSDGRPG
jgi:DNA-binding FadR family transcriptional regulator